MMMKKEALGGACRPPQTPRRDLAYTKFATGGLGGGAPSPQPFACLRGFRP
jgi:hypothetical protein